jgi:hypothetical protein
MKTFKVFQNKSVRKMETLFRLLICTAIYFFPLRIFAGRTFLTILMSVCFNFAKEFYFFMAKARESPFLINPDINVGVNQTQVIIGL